jgi:hypothetical protein
MLKSSELESVLNGVDGAGVEHPAPLLKKKYSTFRLFFRYLASGMNFGDLEFDFKVSQKSIPGIVQETCEVIWNVLQPLEMPEPNKEMWLKKNPLNFINLPIFLCGKCGRKTHQNAVPAQYWIYFNFKKYFSIVFMAVADANYYFTAIMLVHMDVKETLTYLKSQISGNVSLPGNWICLVTSPYPRMTQQKVLQFLMSCLETRLLACQRICCDHILPQIYLMKRYTTAGTPQPDALWSVPLEF